jgi:response regulator RpfG family c-di-GMP phosphodiesterase
LSYQLLDVSSETEFIRISKKIIVQQREHFDGSGFPNKREGNQIHKVAYIVSLIETFDALLSQENYNNKIHTPTQTYDFLKSQSGQCFQPQITKIFLENFEDFIELREQIINKNRNRNKETI